MQLIVAPQVRRDIADVLVWTEEQFGPITLKRTAKLIETALAEIAADPDTAANDESPTA